MSNRDATMTPCSALDRSGLASVRELESEQCLELRRELESVATQFAEKESHFRSPGYPWPRDPFRTWSRVWEYPYVLHHLRKWRESQPINRVVDVGSGVTFFPFACARLGTSVTCVDVDDGCALDIRRATEVVSAMPGRVDFRAIRAGRLPLEDAEADAIYCISVIEHVHKPAELIREMSRVLKPGGLCLLTLDIDLQGNSALGPREYLDLRSALAAHFEYASPEQTTHPRDLLTSWRGPFPMKPPALVEQAKWVVRERLLKPLLGRKSRPFLPCRLAVEGMALTKLRSAATQGIK